MTFLLDVSSGNLRRSSQVSPSPGASGITQTVGVITTEHLYFSFMKMNSARLEVKKVHLFFAQTCNMFAKGN